MAASRTGRLLAILAVGLLLLGGCIQGPGPSALVSLLHATDAGDERWLSVPDDGQETRLGQPAQLRVEHVGPVSAAEPPAALAWAPAHPPEAIYSPAPAPPNILAPEAGPEHGRPSPTGPPLLG